MFPASFTDIPDLAPDGNGVYRPVLANLNDPRAAVRRIEANLGLNAQGAFASVLARLNDVDARIAALPSGGGGGVVPYAVFFEDNATVNLASTVGAGTNKWQPLWTAPDNMPGVGSSQNRVLLIHWKASFSVAVGQQLQLGWTDSLVNAATQQVDLVANKQRYYSGTSGFSIYQGVMVCSWPNPATGKPKLWFSGIDQSTLAYVAVTLQQGNTGGRIPTTIQGIYF